MPSDLVRRFFVTCLVLAVCRVPALGQTTTATLQGAVRDASRAVLPGATVTLRDVNTGFVRVTTTDQAGAYVLSYVPPGTDTLTFELTGFKTLKREALRFEVGQEITIDASLEVAGVAESVIVLGASPVVETTKSAVDFVVSREQIDNLALAGRQAPSLPRVAAGGG